MFGRKKAAMKSEKSQSTEKSSGYAKVHNFFGFSKGYNFILWFTFAGALFGFSLARLQYLDVNGIFCGSKPGANHAAPGECYYYQTFDRYKIGIRLHLYTIIPASLLVVLQFTPIIRYKTILFHRMTGYVVVLLATIANVGALMIARHAFGGGVEVQAWVGLLVIMTMVGLFLAYYNIKRLQIDQHRAWMLRTWFYFASIITLRIIMIIAAQILTAAGDYWTVQDCAKLLDIFHSSQTLTDLYPSCAALVSGADMNAVTLVHVDFNGTAAELMSAMNASFGMAGWIALTLHAVGVEIYLHLTPQETRRLRELSYKRQLEAGHKNPGNSGLVPQEDFSTAEHPSLSSAGSRKEAISPL
ncbi:hypothetical protein LTR95_007204 [Oleoguttula sp. CCFEE 5521]